MIPQREKSSLVRFYDHLDAIEDGDPLADLSDDLEFDIMLPAGGGLPPERFDGGKQDFVRFLDWFKARGPRFQPETGRSHDIDTLTFSDGVELAVGRGLGGTRDGTLLAAAQGDEDGRVRRYAFVMSRDVEFTPIEERVLDPSPRLLQEYFDRVDAVSLEESLDLLADDFQFEMVFPGFDGDHDERISRDKDDFKRFQAGIRARNPRPRVQVSTEARRHHTLTCTVADGLVLVVAETLNGRRNGTIIAAAEADEDGLIKRYLIAMAPAVRFPSLRRSS